ncbi:MAG: ABC transporter ATP-binding protein [Ruminococcaceae bacterium]|nr:ABC transporter ATP-binding protein [Oscillospiraceae bacterium]
MLKCNNVTVKNILNDVSFEICEKSFTAIIGKNGSGKTTLAKCIMAQTKHEGGITVCGTDIRTISPRERAKKIAYLPQHLPSPNITVYELAVMGRNAHLSLGQKLGKCDTLAIDSALEKVCMSEFKDRFIPSLSGGEKQRAFLAMLLAADAEILLLDEPCAYMDMAAEAEFMQLLSMLDKTLIVITHNLSLAVKFADHLLLLDKGDRTFFGSKNECLDCGIIERAFGVKKKECNGEILFYV